MIPRLVVDLDEPGIAPDAVVRVATARVAWMDLPVLLRDFPALGEGPDPAARAEAWLLRHAVVIVATREAIRSIPNAELRALVDAWSRSVWNELRHTPGLVAEGEAWQNAPLLARTALMDVLPADGRR